MEKGKTNEMAAGLKRAAKLSEKFGDYFYDVSVSVGEIRLQGKPNPEIEAIAEKQGFIKDSVSENHYHYRKDDIILTFI